MPALTPVLGPDPIFARIAQPVAQFDDSLKKLCQDMVETLYAENAVGIGANMLGILQRIIVIDLQEAGLRNPQVFINPEIINSSTDQQCTTEASICFPGISAPITRPKKITLQYQDMDGTFHEVTAEDYPAAVIQHEIDYLNGKIFLDYLSPVKRKMLIRKTRKFQNIADHK